MKSFFYSLLFITLFSFIFHLSCQGQAIVPLLQTGHSSEITCMALSADGKFLVTGSSDKTLKVWNLSTGQIIKNYEGHYGTVTSVSFSEDGMYIISSSTDQIVRIWEFIKNPDNKILDKKYEFIHQQALRTNMMTEDGAKAKVDEALSENFGCLQTYKGHSGPIRSVFADNEFKTFITLGADNTIRFWDPLKVKELASIPANNADQLIVSADQSKFYAIENDGTVSIYKYSSKEKTGKLSEASSMISLVASNDKKWIGGLDESHTIHIWDASKHTKIATITGMNPLTDIAFLKGKTSIIFSTADGLKEYDFKTKSLVRTMAIPEKLEEKIAVSNDNRFACGIANKKDLYIIDIQNGIVKNHLPSLSTEHSFNLLSHDGKIIFSLDSNILSSVEVFTGKTQQTVLSSFASKLSVSNDNRTIIAHGKNILMAYSADELKPLLTINTNGKVEDLIWPENSETIFLHYDNQKIYSYSLTSKNEKALFSAEENIRESFLLNQKLITVLNSEGQLNVMDSKNERQLLQVPGINTAVSGFCPMNNLLAVYNTKYNIEIWNTTQKKKLKEIQTGSNAAICYLLFNSTGKYISVLFTDQTIRIYEIETGYQTAGRIEMKKFSKINPISFTPNDKFIFCASLNNRLILWNWKENKDIQILQGVNGAAIFSYDNNYIVSNKGVDLIGFKKGSEYYTFEQFDLHYNRPDKVLQTLGYADENLIKAYRQAYNKRLKKLGFKNSFQGIGIHIPEVIIENSATLVATTKEDKVVFNLKAKDTDYMLRSLVISVNGVPEGGVKGIDISEKKIKEYAGTFEVKLSQGMNQVKIWCMNEKGAESYKKTIQIMCDKPYEKPSLYLVVIGVSNYQNPALNLGYAAKDGRDLIRTLLLQKDQYKEIIIDSLMNESATIEKIISIKKRLLLSKVDDRVIVFFAGHGLLDPNLDYYLATHNVDFANPAAKGLPYEKLEDLLDGIPARNKLLLMDACHSGEVDKDELQLTETKSTVKEDITFRAVPGSTTVKTIGLNNSFEMMKQLFSDLRKGNGTTVISSAGGAEYAMEGEHWKNGVFTYCLLKALTEKKADNNKDNKITLSELQNYLQFSVSEITGGKQKPTSRVENISNDWQLW